MIDRLRETAADCNRLQQTATDWLYLDDLCVTRDNVCVTRQKGILHNSCVTHQKNKHSNKPQHTATHYNTPECNQNHLYPDHFDYILVCCSVLQCAAVCCSVLQCVAVSILGVSHRSFVLALTHSYAVCHNAVQCGAVWRSLLHCSFLACDVSHSC